MGVLCLAGEREGGKGWCPGCGADRRHPGDRVVPFLSLPRAHLSLPLPLPPGLSSHSPQQLINVMERGVQGFREDRHGEGCRLGPAHAWPGLPETLLGIQLPPPPWGQRGGGWGGSQISSDLELSLIPLENKKGCRGQAE